MLSMLTQVFSSWEIFWRRFLIFFHQGAPGLPSWEKAPAESCIIRVSFDPDAHQCSQVCQILLSASLRVTELGAHSLYFLAKDVGV